jgi:hypothetical protein
MDNAESKPDMKDMQEGAYPKKKKESVADQFSTVKYRSETYCWTLKLLSDSIWKERRLDLDFENQELVVWGKN